MVAKRLSSSDAVACSTAKPNKHDGAFKNWFREEGDGIKVKICHVPTTITKISGAHGADAYAKREFWQDELSMHTVVVCFIHRWKVGILEEYFDATGYFIFNEALSDFSFYPHGDGLVYVASSPRDVAMHNVDVGGEEGSATKRSQASA
jgi:hypothetical protein